MFLGLKKCICTCYQHELAQSEIKHIYSRGPAGGRFSANNTSVLFCCVFCERGHLRKPELALTGSQVPEKHSSPQLQKLGLAYLIQEPCTVPLRWRHCGKRWIFYDNKVLESLTAGLVIDIKTLKMGKTFT